MIHPSILMRREVFENVGGYNTDLERAQDFQFWINAKNLGYKFANLGEILTISNANQAKVQDCIINIFKSYENFNKRTKYNSFAYSFVELFLFLFKFISFVKNHFLKLIRLYLQPYIN